MDCTSLLEVKSSQDLPDNLYLGNLATRPSSKNCLDGIMLGEVKGKRETKFSGDEGGSSIAMGNNDCSIVTSAEYGGLSGSFSSCAEDR